MVGRFCALCVLSITCLTALPAQAQWFGNFFRESKGWYHANKAWPDPIVQQDRMSVAVVTGKQIEKGWRRQTLLCDHHFEDGGTRLNQAGEMHLKYILTQVPVRHRAIYVQRLMAPDQTADRVNAIQVAISQMQPNDMPPVYESNMHFDGSPADDVDAVYKKLASTRPDPRLPAPQGEESSK